MFSQFCSQKGEGGMANDVLDSHTPPPPREVSTLPLPQVRKVEDLSIGKGDHHVPLPTQRSGRRPPVSPLEGKSRDQ